MNIIRWLARITGTLIVVFCLAFFFGYVIEGINKSEDVPETYNIILFTLWGISLAALILAWWKEGLGGIISLTGFIIFNILAAVNPVPGASYVFALLIFLIPSILFLIYWRLKRKSLNRISENKI
ncbi:MAG TPA: hypothetical protein PKW80_13620 [Bacteroidales bacterium]|nr:hypothetical protein [Bacteroidales bacterium]